MAPTTYWNQNFRGQMRYVWIWDFEIRSIDDQLRVVVCSSIILASLQMLDERRCFLLVEEVRKLELHPLLKFRLIPEEECALRVLTLQEELKLVESMPSLVSQAYVAILGETGLRMTEGFTLKWELVDLKNRLLTVEKTKGRKARTIPSLSDYAMDWLELLPKDSPSVFTCPSSGTRYHDLRYPLEIGRESSRPHKGRFP
jgi:integrase